MAQLIKLDSTCIQEYESMKRSHTKVLIFSENKTSNTGLTVIAKSSDVNSNTLNGNFYI